MINIITKVEKKKQLNIIKKTKKKLRKEKDKSTKICQKMEKKNIIRERSKNRYYEIKKIKEKLDKIIGKEMLSEYNIKDE